MSYEPTNWKAGDTVTSTKLNKMEQGIANAEGANILVSNCTLDISNNSEDPPGVIIKSAASATINRLDKTLGEILNADFVIVKMIEDNMLIYGSIVEIQSSEVDQVYYITVFTGGRSIYFVAQDESDYPIVDIDDSSDDSGNNGGFTPSAS